MDVGVVFCFYGYFGCGICVMLVGLFVGVGLVGFIGWVCWSGVILLMGVFFRVCLVL